MSRSLAPLVVVALALTACGGRSTADTAAPTTDAARRPSAVSSTPAPSATAGAAAAPSSAPAGTTVPVTPTTAATSASTAAAGGATTTTAPTRPGVAGGRSDRYADAAAWLCRPDAGGDPCDGDLTASVVRPDGTVTVEPFVADEDAPVDCFYVYPTVSGDATPNSDASLDDAERGAAVNQAARFGAACRVFAPLYRQVTVAGLFGSSRGDWGLAYADVREAWRHYLASDNAGRGVVLVGHSQGAGHLARLLREEVEPDAAQRALLVSALLIGSTVPAGGATPPCASTTATGCVVSYATFSASVPPSPAAFFGIVRGGAPDARALCVNPAAPGGGEVPLVSYVPREGAADAAVPPTVTTPFVRFDGAVTASCTTEGAADYLRVTPQGPAGEAMAAVAGRLGPSWGLHLLDVNLAQGDLVALVAAQAAAFGR